MLTVTIFGSGPSALMAATVLAENGAKVQIMDQKKAIARKFLVAGHGGFNLTHSEEVELFLEKYDKDIIKNAVRNFDSEKFREFLKKIKIPTYIGTSGRVFPEKGIKPIEVLYNWKNYLLHLGVEFHMEHRLVDFDRNSFIVSNEGRLLTVKPDYAIFALGGGSWSITGSDGLWVNIFKDKKINILSLESSNSGFEIEFPFDSAVYVGSPIKNCSIYSETEYKKGDLVVTDYGLEGGPTYALSKNVREGKELKLDIKPDLSRESLIQKIESQDKVSDALKDLKISKAVQEWLKSLLNKEEYTNPVILAEFIKGIPLNVKGLRPVEEVISTVGGVSTRELDKNFRLMKFPRVYCIGEMVDWDAPTGGYLIQACVAMGYMAGKDILSNPDLSEED